MKKLLLLAFAAGSLTLVAGCNSSFSGVLVGSSEADLPVVTNVTLAAAIPAGLKALDVDNRFGIVHISGTDSETNVWTWNLTVRARVFSVAQQIASGVSCNAELDGDHLRLVVSLPDSKEPHNVQSDLEITVPKSVAVRAQNRFGRTDITDLGSPVEATDQNGPVIIRNVVGNVRAQTSFAPLDVSKIGPATLKNQNGEIRATDIAGPVEADTSFASLIVADVHGTASLVNQNGSIEATRIGASLEAKTSFDSLTAKDVGGPVHLRNQNGSIRVLQADGDADIETSFASLKIDGIQGNAILANQNGEIIANGITGSVKASTSFAALVVTGAGSKFICHNQNGSIRLDATSSALTNIEAKTSFDTLQVRLSAGLKPAIQARTSFADVESDFPVLMKPEGADPFAGVQPGAAQISLENQNGKISIVRD